MQKARRGTDCGTVVDNGERHGTYRGDRAPAHVTVPRLAQSTETAPIPSEWLRELYRSRRWKW
jgi:hypothetical protein